MFKLDFSNGSAATYSVFTTMINAVLATYSVIQTSGGLTTTTGVNTRIITTIGGTASSGNGTQFLTPISVAATGSIGAGLSVASTIDPNAAGNNLAGVVEFLGYSRIDGYPMFRSFKQANTAQTNSYPYINNTTTGANATWAFDNNRNTFTPNASMLSQIIQVFGVNLSGQFQIDLISALEDQIPGYVGNFNQGGRYPMDRAQEENVYAGQIGPKITTKYIAIGTSMIKSVLRRTDIEDIKANTGIDIIQKMESILVNELSQTMSKQIVWKIQELGGFNRLSAPLYKGPLSTIPNQTMFDLDTAYVASGPGGETTHAVQRKLVTKMTNASHYLLTEGRIGTAQFAVTNGSLAAAMVDNVGYTINPTKSKLNSQGQLYPVGEIGGIQIYVDPYQKFDDNRITIGRKNNAEQPGLLIIPYLMAQSVTITSEATMAPVMQIRSRYAIAEVGFFPFKQYMTIIVNDNGGYLN
jgi:hypothetical protein